MEYCSIFRNNCKTHSQSVCSGIHKINCVNIWNGLSEKICGYKYMKTRRNEKQKIMHHLHLKFIQELRACWGKTSTSKKQKIPNLHLNLMDSDMPVSWRILWTKNMYVWFEWHRYWKQTFQIFPPANIFFECYQSIWTIFFFPHLLSHKLMAASLNSTD